MTCFHSERSSKYGRASTILPQVEIKIEYTVGNLNINPALTTQSLLNKILNFSVDRFCVIKSNMQRCQRFHSSLIARILNWPAVICYANTCMQIVGLSQFMLVRTIYEGRSLRVQQILRFSGIFYLFMWGNVTNVQHDGGDWRR